MHGYLSSCSLITLTSSHTICPMAAPSASPHHNHIPTSPATASTLSFRAETSSNMHVWCLCHVHSHYFWLCVSLSSPLCAKRMRQSAHNQFFGFVMTLLHVWPRFEAPVLSVWVFGTKSLLVTGSFGVWKGVKRGKAWFFGGKTAKNVFFGYTVSFWCQIPWFDLVGS